MQSPEQSSQLIAGAVLATGDVIGGYRILAPSELSSVYGDPGGFAIAAALYRAERVSSGLPVVLKVLKREHSAEDPFAKAFIREATQVAAFVHPNVVSVYDAGLERGWLYLAMQAIDGGTLLDRIRAGGPAAAQAVALLAPLAEMLDAAHAAGLVHGDVTPSAIMIDTEGVPRLTAFNVIRRLPEAGVGGVRLQDISYASPELLSGQRLTGAADIYSLTAVLSKCLTGEVPARDDSGARIARLVSRRGRASRSRRGAQSLEAVIARGMAKTPADRYATAQRLIEDAATVLTSARTAGTSTGTAAGRAETAAGVAGTAAGVPGTAAGVPGTAAGVAGTAAGVAGTVVAGSSSKPPHSVPTFMRRRRNMAGLACGALAVLAVAVAVAGGGAHSVRAKRLLPTAGAQAVTYGPLTIRYEPPWQLSVARVPTSFAVTGSLISAPISLTSSSATLLAGPLTRSAPVPGGVPPQLARRYGRASASSALIGGFAARRYDWTLAGGQALIAFVLPTTRSDLALICVGSALADPALTSCEGLAGAASVSGVAVLPPGPDARLEAALKRDLARLRSARYVGTGSLPARAAAASQLAHLAARASALLDALAPPARSRQQLAALRGALKAQSVVLAALGAAAAADDRSAYTSARTRVLAAGRSLSAAAASLAAEGLKPPTLRVLYVVPVAPSPSPSTIIRSTGVRYEPITRRVTAISRPAPASTSTTSSSGVVVVPVGSRTGSQTTTSQSAPQTTSQSAPQTTSQSASQSAPQSAPQSTSQSTSRSSPSSLVGVPVS